MPVDFALFPRSFSCRGSLSVCSLCPFTADSPNRLPTYTLWTHYYGSVCDVAGDRTHTN